MPYYHMEHIKIQETNYYKRGSWLPKPELEEATHSYEAAPMKH